jgi:hypothetical protein
MRLYPKDKGPRVSKQVHEYRPPRLTIEISEAQEQKLRRLIPHGTKKYLFSAIIDDLIPLLELHGEMAIAAILSRKLKLVDWAQSLKEEKDGHS